MEDWTIIATDELDQFYDADEEFPLYDCIESFSQLRDCDDDESLLEAIPSEKSALPAPRTILRRRRSHSNRTSGDQESSSLSSAVTSENSISSKERKSQSLRKGKENNEMDSESLFTDVAPLNSSLMSSGNQEIKESSANTAAVDSDHRESYDHSSNFLLLLAGMVIKIIGFQINLLVGFITFPIRFTYNLYMFVVDPFQITRRLKRYFVKKVCINVYKCILSFFGEWLKEHKSLWKLGLKFGWGLLWAIYAGVVLVGLLVSAFLIGGVVMRYLVEEPIRIKEMLNFDYTVYSPVAFVPIIACPRVEHGAGYKETVDTGKFVSRVIPLRHKLQVTVSLMLPESDYNRNLGNFQVRVDFLAIDGKPLGSLRRPCMLPFKSQPIRLLLTFLKVAPLIAGYSSETQSLSIYLRGFTEGAIPTACLKVTLEQRAEFQFGAGVPEIYDASLTLESELPLMRRILWQWKKTVFVWISMTLFVVQFLFALLCCKSLIIPRVRLRRNSSHRTPAISSSVQN